MAHTPATTRPRRLNAEMLGATTRPGKYGGPLENRMRFITQIIHAIRSAAPGRPL